VVNNDPPPGDESFKFKVLFHFPQPTPVIDPLANGLTLQVTDPNGTVLYTRVIPANPLWRVNGQHTKWKYSDPNGSVGGITKAQVFDKSKKQPGLWKFVFKGRDADFQVEVPEAPPRVSVGFGDATTLTTGQCATLVFNPSSSPTLRCTFSGIGKVLTCK
jgi:hypothetical protein